jgi:type IV secretion system protein VirD4
MSWLFPTEREKWATPATSVRTQPYLGLPTLDARSRELYERALPRGVMVPRFVPDRPAVNYWMPPYQLAQYGFVPGQIILGKLGGQYLGYIDDRPQIPIAGARAGKTSPVLEPNLYLYPGSMLVLDPKGELARTAHLRRALGHDVYVLDPFGQSGIASASYNVLSELDPDSVTIVDDVAAITEAVVVQDGGDPKARHFEESAQTLLKGIILLTLTLPENERTLVTARDLLSLTYPSLLRAAKMLRPSGNGKRDEDYYTANDHAVEALLSIMARSGGKFGGILAAVGNRFLGTPPNERGSIFSTASVQTDFLDSLPLRLISKRSDFKLRALRGDRPVTIYLCLPVGRAKSHFRWLRLVVQMACTVLEQMGAYPRDRAPILFMMEEFATLGHMEIMERAAAYFPGFGIKLWAVLQDTTQLQRYYTSSWETFLGNAGLVQCFATGDQTTLNYLAGRLQNLIAPFELRNVFSRRRFNQLLMFEGEPPAAAMRLEHEDVTLIRERIIRWAQRNARQARSLVRGPSSSASSRAG